MFRFRMIIKNLRKRMNVSTEKFVYVRGELISSMESLER
jgi:hypothetical protein